MKKLALILTVLFMLMTTTVIAEGNMNEILITGSMGEIYGILQLPETGVPVPLIILSAGGGSQCGISLGSVI